jgi:hypothetical protein
MRVLDQYLADSVEHTVPLTRDDAVFDVGEDGDDWFFVFSAKNKREDEDSEAVFQKTSGAGMSVTGSEATISVLRVDTEELRPKTLFCGIRATHVSGDSFTAWEGKLRLDKAVGQEVTSSVEIFTIDPPFPASVVSSIDAAPTLTPITGAEEVPSVIGGVLKKITWTAIKDWLAGFFADISHASTHATGGGDDITPADIGAEAQGVCVPYTGATGNLDMGEYAISTGGQDAAIFTFGQDAYIYTSGQGASIYTSGQFAAISTSGEDAYISTFGEAAYISTIGPYAYIQTASTFNIATAGGNYKTIIGNVTPTLGDQTINFPDTAGAGGILMVGANNLSDLTNASTARTNLGAGAAGAEVFQAGTDAAILEQLGFVRLRRTQDSTRTNTLPIADSGDGSIILPALVAGRNYRIDYILIFGSQYSGGGGFSAQIQNASTNALVNTLIGTRYFSASTASIAAGTTLELGSRGVGGVITTVISGFIFYAAASNHTPVFAWGQAIILDGQTATLRTGTTITITEI